MALPYALAAYLTRGRSHRWPNAVVDHRAAAIHWGSKNLEFISIVYPPLPTGIAAVLPGGPLVLAFAGAVAAGLVLQTLWHRLSALGLPWWASAAVLAGTGATPVFAVTAVSDLGRLVCVSLLVVAIAGLLRFAVRGEPGGGFQAGLALGVAAACDLATAVYAVAVGAATPLIARHRYRGARNSVPAAALVVLFPTVVCLGGWAFLEWRYTRTVFHTVVAHPHPAAVVVAALAVAATPVYWLSAALQLRRRSMAGLVLALPLVGLVVNALVGLADAGSAADRVVLTLVGAVALPARPSRRLALLIAAAAVAQAAIGWVVLVPRP